MNNLRSVVVVCVLSLMLMGSANAQWVQTNGPYGGYVSSFAVSGTNLFAGTLRVFNPSTMGGAFLSTDNGANWTPVNTGLTSPDVTAFAVSPNGAGGTNLFAGTDTGGVFLSTNNGTSWTAVNTGLTNTSVRALAVSPNEAGGTNLFAGTYYAGVFLSTNNGTSWTAVNTWQEEPVWALAVSGTNLLAGTRGGGVFLSSNNGTSWTAVNTGLTDGNVFALAVSGTNLFAGTSGGAFLSTDNGANWTQVNTGLTSPDFAAFAVSPNGAGSTNLFAGGNGGVFLSTNNGTSWTAASTGLPSNTGVGALAVSGTNLFDGTWGGGVWRRPLSEMITSVEGHSIDLPTHFSLAQNYPNPFNPSTTIRYGLPQRADVSLVVFNTLGQQVATLFQGEQEAGYHEVKFDGSGLASGVYFYWLQAGSFVQTMRLLLLR